MSEESFRGFVAVPSPGPLLSRLKNLQQELKQLELDAKWVALEQIHLTVKFLGQTPSSILESIKASLDKIAQEHPAFSFPVDRFGVFPNAREPRILWVGSSEASSPLQKLTVSLEDAMHELGFVKEKRDFKGHLTLARLRTPKQSYRLQDWMHKHPISWREEFPCERLILFQSTLTPKGSIYQPLHSSLLREP